MLIVPMVITPPEREKEATTSLVGLYPVTVGIHREPVLAAEDRGLGDALELVLKLGDLALHLGLVDTGLARCDELLLDLADELDGVVERGIGDVDGGRTEAERILNRGERPTSERIVVAIDQ